MKTKRSKAKIRVGHKRRSAICSKPEQKLEVLRPDAAGIDCGAEEHYIAVPRTEWCSVSRYLRDFSQINCDGVSHAVYGAELKF
jgi:hypothetical protein